MSSLKKIIKTLDFGPSLEDNILLKNKTSLVIRELKRELKRNKVGASVFVGGSFAKATMMKKNVYDVDIFIRFDKKHFQKDLKKLNSVISRVSHNLSVNYISVHGSRDYYRIEADKRIIYEIIPAIKVRKPEEAENVMDLSYFHVEYMNKKLNKNMRKEIMAAKAFCLAQGVYGAESYIQGFSGYAVECLIAHYKTFDNMLKKLTAKSDKIFIDDKKYYKNKNEAFIQMNESKLQSPVIAIDPTWKKRNVLASLSFETFIKFQEAGRELLSKPSTQAFVKVEHTKEDIMEKAENNKGEFAEIKLQTTKQEGDIAGTKMKKAMRFILSNIDEHFSLLKHEFLYRDGKESTIYVAAKSKRAITLNGPPVKMTKHAKAFRKEHGRCFVKNNKLYAIEPVNESLKEFLKNKFSNSKELKSMSINKIEIN